MSVILFCYVWLLLLALLRVTHWDNSTELHTQLLSKLNVPNAPKPSQTTSPNPHKQRPQTLTNNVPKPSQTTSPNLHKQRPQTLTNNVPKPSQTTSPNPHKQRPQTLTSEKQNFSSSGLMTTSLTVEEIV